MRTGPPTRRTSTPGAAVTSKRPQTFMGDVQPDFPVGRHVHGGLAEIAAWTVTWET